MFARGLDVGQMSAISANMADLSRYAADVGQMSAISANMADLSRYAADVGLMSAISADMANQCRSSADVGPTCEGRRSHNNFSNCGSIASGDVSN